MTSTPSVAPDAPDAASGNRFRRGAELLRSWLDSSAVPAAAVDDASADRIDWPRIIPFVLLHLACLGALWTGVSTTAVVVAIALYALRMFAITAFYHRYFSHRAFSTSRAVQFVFGFIGNMSAQRGPLWWAAPPRKHHKHSDTERDAHSPTKGGFWWSHVFWFTTKRNFPTDLEQVRDFARFPELRFIDRYDILAPLTLIVLLFGMGEAFAAWAPGLGTDGPQLVVWGFFISTTVLFHGTSTINSLGHLFGTRRYETTDTSRNNFWLALITLGEGWHNNHHFYPVSTRQGFFWWELDLSYCALRAMAACGLVWDLRPVPAHVLAGQRTARRTRRAA
ncbi:MAG: acyl-CoA desaturase [Planctomycetota bacterium]